MFHLRLYLHYLVDFGFAGHIVILVVMVGELPSAIVPAAAAFETSHAAGDEPALYLACSVCRPHDGSINVATHPHTNILQRLPTMRGRGCGAFALTFEQRGRCTFLCPCRVPVPPPPATAVSSLPVLCMARQCVMMMTTSIAGRPRKRPRSSPTWVRQAGRHPYFLPSRLW